MYWEEFSIGFNGGDNRIPYEVTPAPLFCHISWMCCEKYPQRGDTREQISDRVYNGGGSLRIGLSVESLEKGPHSTNLVIGIS